MREAEYAATMASIMDSNYEYPKDVSQSFGCGPLLTCDSESTRLGRISSFANSMTFCLEVV